MRVSDSALQQVAEQVQDFSDSFPGHSDQWRSVQDLAAICWKIAAVSTDESSTHARGPK